MYKLFGKRLLDICFCLIGLPFFFFIFIILAPIIWWTDKGPIFYNADRLGKKGNVFKMYKFRSMYVNAPDIRNTDGSTYNAEDDPRVTSIGKLMRKTRVDEIPQILNVLKGDRSIIGPRPFVTTHYQGYDKLDEMLKKRLEVMPGITGYSQAYFRNSITQDEKIKQDCYYVDHLTLWMDIKIFIQTIKIVLKHENVYVSKDIVKKEK